MQFRGPECLRFTFSTRDTGQSFFFQDYDLHVSITPGNKMVSVRGFHIPMNPRVLMETVEIVAGLPGWQGWLVFRRNGIPTTARCTEQGNLSSAPISCSTGSWGYCAPLAGLL